MPITVAIVEDNAAIGQELQHILAQAPDLACIACCRNVTLALATLPAAHPDVILMDIQLPGRSGIQCVQRLKPLLPRTQILMFTICDDADRIMSALAAGAVGYLLKSSSPAEIIAAIRNVHNGGAPMTGEVARKVVQNIHQQSRRPGLETQLTYREQEVLQLLARGLLDKQIADQLNISLLTVNSHLKHIYTKLGVHSRTEVVARYLAAP